LDEIPCGNSPPEHFRRAVVQELLPPGPTSNATANPSFSGAKIFAAMGMIPTVMYDGNICITPGCGTTDSEGHLIEDRMRWAVKAVVKVLELVSKYAGVLD